MILSFNSLLMVTIYPEFLFEGKDFPSVLLRAALPLRLEGMASQTH